MKADLTHNEFEIASDFADKHCPPGSRVVFCGIVIEYMRMLKQGKSPSDSAKTVLLEGYHIISHTPRIPTTSGDDTAQNAEKLALDLYFKDFINSPRSYSKGTCKGQFSGSERLFAACWRDLLRYRRHTEIDTQADADRWLDQIAGEKVNNPKSSFYIHGK